MTKPPPKLHALPILALLFNLTSAQAQTVLAEGLQFPQKLVATSRGNFLVSEGGSAVVNTGRVSLVGRDGARRSLLEGLPAARGHGIAAFGPAGMALDGRTLYLVIGEGDVQVGPPFVLNQAGSSSPIFAGVLRIVFSADVDLISSPFQLGSSHWTLFDGYQLELRNTNGDTASVSLMTAFRPLVRNILGGTAPMRQADPYSMVFDANTKALFVVDSGSDTLVRIDTLSGRAATLVRFQPDVRAGVAIDSVPTAVCQTEDGFLISFLTGNPFPVGAASVRRWKPADSGWAALSPLIGGLTRVVDMICINPRSTTPRVVTVEYLIDGTAPTLPTGRVQVFDGSAGKIVADKLALPTAVVHDPSTNELLVLTLAGQILRFPVP